MPMRTGVCARNRRLSLKDAGAAAMRPCHSPWLQTQRHQGQALRNVPVGVGDDSGNTTEVLTTRASCLSTAHWRALQVIWIGERAMAELAPIGSRALPARKYGMRMEAVP